MQVIKKALKWLAGITGSIILILFVISLLILLPPIQHRLTTSFTQYLRKNHAIESEVGSIRIGPTGNVVIGDFLLQSQSMDTIAYFGKFKAKAHLLKLLRKQVQIRTLDIRNVNINIHRAQSDSLFNISSLAYTFGKKDPDKTKSKSRWSINLNKIYLENWRLDLNDEYLKSQIFFEIGELDIRLKKIDLSNTVFDIKSVYIANSQGYIHDNQSRSDKSRIKKITPVNSNKKNSDTKDPVVLIVSDIQLEDLSFELSLLQRLYLKSELEDAAMRNLDFNIGELNLKLDEASLDNTWTKLEIFSPDSVNGEEQIILEPEKIEPPVSSPFGNNPMDFTVGRLALNNSEYHMKLNEKARRTDGLDYLNYDLSDIQILIRDAHIDQDSISTIVDHLTCRELGGLSISDLNGKFSIDDSDIRAESFELITPGSQIRGSVTMGYPGLRKIGDDVGKITFNTNLKKCKINLGDVQRSVPSVLNSWPLNWDNSIQLQTIEFTGPLSDLNIKSMHLDYLSNTTVRLSGWIKNLPDIHHLNSAICIDTLSVSRDNIMSLLTDSSQIIPYPVPEYLQASGRLNGTPEDLQSNVLINSDFGRIAGNTELAISDIETRITGSIDLKEFDLGMITESTLFHKADLEAEYVFSIQENHLRHGNFTANIQNFDFYQYQYDSIMITGKLDNEEFVLRSDVSDDSFQGELSLQGTIIDSIYNINGNANIETLRLDSANIYPMPISFEATSDFEFYYKDTLDFSGSFFASDVRLRKNELENTIDTINFSFNNSSSKGTNARFYSDLMDAYLVGNVQYNAIPDIINDHINRFLTDKWNNEQYEDRYFGFGLDIHKPEIITTIFSDHISAIDIGRFRGMFDGTTGDLEVDVIVPEFVYDNVRLDSARLLIESAEDRFDGSLHLRQFGYDTLITHDLLLTTEYIDDHFTCDLSSYDHDENTIFNLISDIAFKDSIYYVKIRPGSLILDYKHWQIPEDNLIKSNKSILTVDNFLLSQSNESLLLTADKNTLNAKIGNLNFSNLLSILQNDHLKDLLKGNIDGDVMIQNTEQGFVFTTDLRSNNFLFQEQEVELLRFRFDNSEISSSELIIDLKSANNELELKRRNSSEIRDSHTTVKTDLRDLSFFSFLLPEFLADPSGKLKGDFTISNRNEITQMNGQVNFENSSMAILPLNTRLSLMNETILLRNNKVELNNFNIIDSANNKIVLNGSVITDSFDDLAFDLRAKSPGFRWLNSDASHSENFFGNLTTSLDLHLSGTNKKPKIDTEIEILKQTDITLVMPGKELEMISDEGIVYFSKEDITGHSLINQSAGFIGDSIAEAFGGLKLTARLITDEDAKFNVILDPNSGDFTEFNIAGNIAFTYDPVSKSRMNGIVEFRKEGFYELSFYGLVKKRFLFGQGSAVSWSNRVMDGDLNFTAKHIVQTNSAGLVSDEISEHEKSRYNQRLPYEVILHVTGTIANPQVNFGIDLPERFRGDYPIVDSKLASLNQPEMEAERNKQVFALLVAGTFIPGGSSSGSSSTNNFATTAARNSVNSILTQQLNNLSSQIIKGVDVNFGMNTFEDYRGGSSEIRTQLDVQVSKNLFSDRVTVEVESHIDLEGNAPQVGQDKTAGMMEFAVLYQLTENGNYRIKAFRENAFDIYDGEILNAGFALIFIKDIDKKQRRRYSTPTGDRSVIEK